MIRSANVSVIVVDAMFDRIDAITKLRSINTSRTTTGSAIRDFELRKSSADRQRTEENKNDRIHDLLRQRRRRNPDTRRRIETDAARTM
jgi:hypothetical protein